MDSGFVVEDLLQDYWGYRTFRPLQKEIIHSVLAGRDTVALLPTGGGKSVCYQLPALTLPGMCLVISPLIALMQDQIKRLKQLDIPAAALHSGLGYRQCQDILESAQRGKYKLLYIAPERLQTRTFKAILYELPVSFLAVDEAHCISQWGHDFRPAYLNIAQIKKMLPKIPILALTATATKPVLEDMVQYLQLRQPALYRGSFKKPNLYYSARYSDDRMKDAIEAVEKAPGTCLVYCRSRGQTELLTKNLLYAGIPAVAYHAGMSSELRHAAQETWMNGMQRVMVATTAFGMGIDKGTVKLVVHYDIPEHLEAYYQEAGRAGRDGQPAQALCLYNEGGIRGLQKSIALRFPKDAYLRQVYQAVCEYLQIPIGTAPEQYYPFAIEDLSKRFDLKPAEAIYALRLLEQEGLWTITESVNSMPVVQIITDRYRIDDLIDRYPLQGNVALALLRLYGTVFQTPTPIRLSKVARQSKMKTGDVEMTLQQLKLMGVVDYEQAKDGPQLFFHHLRVNSNHLHIDHERIRKLRERCEVQIAAMVGYLKEERCKEHMLLQYFDEQTEERCGHCDWCIAQQTKTNIDIKAEIIKTLTRQSPLDLKNLMNMLDQHDTDTVLGTLRSMMDEAIIKREDGNQFSLV